MFCKKCGQEIKEGVKYCPKCGNETESTLSPARAGSQAIQFQQSGRSDQKKNNRKRIVYLCTAVAVIVLAGIIIGLLIKKKQDEEATIIGEWVSDDLVNLEDAIENILEGAGVPSLAADLVKLTSLGRLGELTLTFTNSGEILAGMDGMSLGVGKITYEEISEGRLLLKFELDASILGTSIPIEAGYTADYTVSKNSMEIDFFGCEISFTRVSQAETDQ